MWVWFNGITLGFGTMLGRGLDLQTQRPGKLAIEKSVTHFAAYTHRKRPNMESNQEKPTPSNPLDESGQPDPQPKAGKRLIGLFRWPEWFRQRTPGTPPTEEERAKLKEWFEQQLRERPLKLDDPQADGDLASPPDEPER